MSLRIDLTVAEQSELEALLRATTDDSTPTSLNDLLGQWSEFVRAVECGYEDSIYEYTNDLSVRDLLEGLVVASSSTLQDKLKGLLAPVDERFAIATEPAIRPLSAAPGDHASWWRRVPRRRDGELAHDLEAMGHIA